MDGPSVRERLRYKNISWLMPSVDVPTVLDKLGIEHEGVRGGEIRGFCPDHHLYTGRQPSHPYWTVNIETGETFCFTEGRGSNLVWIVRRLLECRRADDAAKFLAGSTSAAMGDLELAGLRNRLRKMRRQKVDEEGREVSGLGEIGADLAARPTSDRLYEFFVNPPGSKGPTNISRETVDRFEVFERSWGYYCDRAIIPFRHDGQLVGFCAVDLLGESGWTAKHPAGGDYRKTLYPLGFGASDCLYGYDDCRQGDRVMLVEDARSRMKLWQEGWPSCCALLGSSIHGPQIRLLATLAPEEVLLLMDGDSAGREATDKIAAKLVRNFKVRPCYVPVGKDPKNLDSSEIQKVVKKSRRLVAKA